MFHQIALFLKSFCLLRDRTQLDVTLMMNLGEVEKITESFLNDKQT